jgi:succinoglycan biosynthesis transport protein ExoP
MIAAFRAWLPLMVAATVLAGATAFVISSLQQKTYEAKAILIVGQSLSAANPDYNQLLVAEGLSTTYAAIAETRPILEKVIRALALDDSPKQLSDRVQIDVPRGSTLMTISVLHSNPAFAAAIANELGAQLIAASPAIRGRDTALQESIDRDLAAIEDQIQTTQTRIQILTDLDTRTADETAELRDLEDQLITLRSTFATLLPQSSASASNVLTVVEPAVAPTVPVSPLPLLNTLLAAVLGLLAVAGIAFVTEQLDDSIKDADAVREVTNLGNLGTIGQIKGDRGRSEIYRMVTLLYPRSSVAESYRALRVNVDFASIDAPPHTLLVTSAAPGEGKTTTASNLAVAFAQAGRRVLLVDADLRWPGVQKYFNLPNVHGLTTLLRGEATNVDAVAQPSEQANLRILTTGQLPPNPAEQLGSQRMQVVLGLLRQSADLVIFDSPPLQAVADAAVVSAFADATLLVIDAGHSRRRHVTMATATLTRAGANVLGVVLNRVAAEQSFHYYPGHLGESDAGPTVRPPVPAASPEPSGSSAQGPGRR